MNTDVNDNIFDWNLAKYVSINHTSQSNENISQIEQIHVIGPSEVAFMWLEYVACGDINVSTPRIQNGLLGGHQGDPTYINR